MKLPYLSEIIIKPEKSITYFRFILIVSVFTLTQVLYCSMNILFKLPLCFLIMFQMIHDFREMSPCSNIYKIHWRNKQWALINRNGSIRLYPELKILIHNMIFQVIQLSDYKKNKIVIIFNDQIPISQLKILHLARTKSGI